MSNRSRTFQTLKPICVDLGQKILQFGSGSASAHEITASLESLKEVLSTHSLPKHGLDDKLAEYVFFPITQVFRISQQLPSKALEVALHCVATLLQSGWRQDIMPDLAAQLLILLTFLAGGSLSNNEPTATPEELHIAAFLCLTSLFAAVENSPSSRIALVNSASIPALGHAITVTLDGATGGRSRAVQLSSLQALKALLKCLSERDVIASFLPGIVSSLTKILTPGAKSMPPYKVLALSLQILSSILSSVLADKYVAPLLDKENSTTLPQEASTVKTSKSLPLDTSWLKATAGQIKLALASVIRQRQHDRMEVRQELFSLCQMVLTSCRRSLADSSMMMVETMITLAQSDDNHFNPQTAMVKLVAADSSVAELVRESLYEWLISLPRVMQANDDSAKQRSIGRVITSFNILKDTEIDLGVMQNVMKDALRDSVVNAIHIPKRRSDNSGQSGEVRAMQSQLISTQQGRAGTEFQPVLVEHKSGRETVVELQSLVRQIAKSESSTLLARDLLENAKYSQDEGGLASFWIAFNILKHHRNDKLSLEDIVDFGDIASLPDELSEEIYSFALSLLENHFEDQSADWRMRALALEVVAFRATELKTTFRTELVDALYPVLHLVGSNILPLRDHAMTALNVTAVACGYSNAKELLIENVDYLVNAVGMKLSVFDISPQLPQVLLMMIKICGPTLLPYLDDLADNVFEALECFQGYPKLVNILFSVLNGMVEEGVKAPQITKAIKEKEPSEPSIFQPMNVAELIKVLCNSRRQRPTELDLPNKKDAADEELPHKAPQSPWKVQTNPTLDQLDDESDPGPPRSDLPVQKPTKTYSLIQRITALTQHHLPAAPTSTRLSLLHLLTTALPYLSAHEDAYLPLINTLWPVLTPRLNDAEAHVVAAVLDIMGSMCVGAGEFMLTRVQVIWPEIRRIWKGVDAILKRAEKNAAPLVSPAIELAPSRAHTELDTPRMPAISLSLDALSTAAAPSQASTLLHSPSAALATSIHTAPKTRAYVPTPTLHLHASLSCFLARVLAHVDSGTRLPYAISAETVGVMLRRVVVDGSSWLDLAQSEEIRIVLEAWSPDAVWLVREKARSQVRG